MNPHTPSPLVIAWTAIYPNKGFQSFPFLLEGRRSNKTTQLWMNEIFLFELHAIVSVVIFWCTLEKSWISVLTRGLQTLATSWQITKHIDLHPPSQLELDAHLPRPSSPRVLEWNLHVKKCKLFNIRLYSSFSIDGFHGTWLHFRRARVRVCV